MKYQIEMQVRYVPLPEERRLRWTLAMKEIFMKAREACDVDANSSCDGDDEFVFGC